MPGSGRLRLPAPGMRSTTTQTNRQDSLLECYGLGGSTNKNLAVAHAEMFKTTISRTIKVKCPPLADILKSIPVTCPIVLLDIDVEGYDLPVLQSNDWNPFRPKIVMVETQIKSGIDDFMHSIGYSPLARIGLNTVYGARQ
jgi:hypothetical protein